MRIYIREQYKEVDDALECVLEEFEGGDRHFSSVQPAKASFCICSLVVKTDRNKTKTEFGLSLLFDGTGLSDS